jgi:hypothetical protein
VQDTYIDVPAAGFDASIRYEERRERDMIAIPIGPRRQRFATARSAGLFEPARTPRTSARPSPARLHRVSVRQRSHRALGISSAAAKSSVSYLPAWLRRRRRLVGRRRQRQDE